MILKLDFQFAKTACRKHCHLGKMIPAEPRSVMRPSLRYCCLRLGSTIPYYGYNDITNENVHSGKTFPAEACTVTK